MDWNQVEGQWNQVKGKVKEKWSKLTDDELGSGKRDQVLGAIQKKYGISRDEAEKQLYEISAQKASTSKPPGSTAKH